MKYSKHLSAEQVVVIRELINEGVSLKEIQNAFGINRNTLHGISANNSYIHVDPKAKAKKGRTDLTRFKEGYAQR